LRFHKDKGIFVKIFAYPGQNTQVVSGSGTRHRIPEQVGALRRRRALVPCTLGHVGRTAEQNSALGPIFRYGWPQPSDGADLFEGSPSIPPYVEGLVVDHRHTPMVGVGVDVCPCHHLTDERDTALRPTFELEPVEG
jgi:hypothetical protein